LERLPQITKIYGPPGTGKTTWMLNRLDEELKSVPLHRIAYVTFSVSAREEAKNRALSRLTASPEQFKFFRTIHGICYSEAHLSGSNVMQVEDYLDFGKEHGIKFSDDYTDEYDIDGLPMGYGGSAGNRILNIRQVASARQIDPFSEECRFLDWPRDISSREIRHVLCNYGKYKLDRTKFDFVDMLEMYAQQGEPLPIDVMFIDEAQDLSKLQWALVHQMSANSQRVYIAGDDDQSIYGFLGADPLGFYHHKADNTVFLRKSYRLRRHIWDMANRIISPVKEREQKEVDVRAEGGIIEHWNRPVDEVLTRVGDQDNVMVISQTNHSLAALANRLERGGIPCVFKGKSIAGGEQAQRVFNYLSARGGASVPAKGAINLGRLLQLDVKPLMERARLAPELAVSKDELTAMGVNFNAIWTDYLARGTKYRAINDKLRQTISLGGLDAIMAQPRVELTTYHASKGRESHTVILVTDCSPAAFEHAVRDPDNERRVAYVGVTRAKERLIKISPQTSEYMRAFQ
jgi:DNA helicase-2/ATP-dependent DNA helicase PcrA